MMCALEAWRHMYKMSLMIEGRINCMRAFSGISVVSDAEKTEVTAKQKVLLAFLAIALVLGENSFFHDFDVFGVAATPLRIIVPLITVYLFAERLIRHKPVLPSRTRVFTFFVVLMLAWIVYLGIQVLFIPSLNAFGVVFKMLSYALLLMAGYSALLLIDSKNAFLFVVRVLRVLLLCFIVLAFFEIVFDIHLPSSQLVDPAFLEQEVIVYYMGSEPRWYAATGICYNPNDFCALIAVIAALSLPHPTESKRVKYYALILFSLALIVISGTGATIVTLALAAAFAVWLVFLKLGWKKNIGAVAGFLFISLGLSSWLMMGIQSFITLMSWNAGSALIDPMSDLGQHLANYSAGDGSLWNRLHMYSDLIKSIPDSYGLGFGPGGVLTYFQEHPSVSGLLNPHNWWLEVPVTYGIAITLLYICFLVYIVVCLIRKARLTGWFGYAIVLSGLASTFFAAVAPAQIDGFVFQWIAVILAVAILSLDVGSQKTEDEGVGVLDATSGEAKDA